MRVRSLVATGLVTRVGVVSILSDFGGRRFDATENRIIFCDLVVWRNSVGGAGSGRLGPGLDAAGIGWKRISSFRPFGETRGDRVFP